MTDLGLFRVKLLTLQLSLTPAPFYNGADGWDTIHIQAFTERFGFDNVRISHVQTVRQKQSNVNAPWDVYICPNCAFC